MTTPLIQAPDGASIVLSSTTTPAADAPGVVVRAAGAALIGGTTLTPIGVMTRPADTTAYTAGDAVTTATSSAAPLIVANAARVSGGSGVILGGAFSKSTTSVTNASFRIWLFDTTPAAIPNDNAAWLVPVFAERATLIGTVTVDFATAGVVGSDGVRAPLTMPRGSMAFVAASTSLVAIIEARGAYTPGSGEQFALQLDILAD